MKAINWRKVQKQDLKSFKTWLKTEPLLFKKSFYTKFFNINNEFILNSKSIEFAAYNILFLNSKYKEEVILEDLLKIQGKDLQEVLTKFIVISVDPKSEKDFEYVMKWIFKVIEYKTKKIKDLDYELKLAQEYWHFVNSLEKNYIVNFNNWIIFLNKNFYIQNYGFLK